MFTLLDNTNINVLTELDKKLSNRVKLGGSRTNCGGYLTLDNKFILVTSLEIVKEISLINDFVKLF